MGLSVTRPTITKALVALCLVCGSAAAVQTARIDGVTIIGGGYRAHIAQLTKTLKDEREGWAEQVAQAEAARVTFERQAQEIADNAEETHATLAADNAGLRDFIAANRLRYESAANTATGASNDHGASLPKDASATALVATSEADLITCDANYTYAAAAHDWSATLITSGLAK